MLSVFITPWMNPTSIQRATSDAWASTTGFEEREVRVLRVDDVRVVAGDRVVGEAPHERRIVARGCVLERADAEMARRDPGEHRAGQHGVARDPLAGRDDGQRPGRGDAERMHRLADHVLAQHRADRGLAVTAAGERRATRALQVQVATAPVDVEHLTEQERPTVAEARRVPAELVAGVGLRHRRRAVRRGIADEQGHALGCSQRIGIDTQLGGQLLVERQQPRAPARPPPATAGTSRSGRERRSCRTRTVAGPRRS